jgi:hypothetical protein
LAERVGDALLGNGVFQKTPAEFLIADVRRLFGLH